MKEVQRSNRRRLAWFLLIILCLQRVVGSVGKDLVYTVEIAMNMDQQEQVIADKIKSETGFDTHIRIHDDEEIAFQQKLGYLTPFLFSEEIDGQTYFYTVDNSPLTTVEYSPPETKQPDPEAPYSSKSYSDWLFPKFYFRGSHFSMHQFPTLSIRGTTIPHFGEDPFLTIPSPPPETA